MADQDDCRQRCKEEGAEMSDIPAFPTQFFNADKQAWIFDKGMTLRDYFAAKAMQALLARETKICDDPMLYTGAAYDLADAMMKERKA